MGSRWSLLIKIEYFVEKFAYTNLMKKIFLIISFILFFCNSVFADWEKLGEVERGGEYFVEKDTSQKESGYIYFWKMVDYTKPFLDSNFYSAKVYIKVIAK